VTTTVRAQATATRARGLRKSSLALTLGSLATVLIVWELLPRTGLVNRTILPTVGDTVGGLGRLVTSGYWWEDLQATLVAVVIAWVLGCAVGIATGITLGTSPFIRSAITPYAIAVQALPKVVLAPLIIGWLGFGTESKIALAVAICFFPVWIDTMIGLSLPSADEFKLMAALRASRRQTFLKLQLPSAVPMIMVGVKHSLLLAFTGVLVAEILAASAGGLGTLVKEFSLQLNMPLTVAVVLVVVVIAVALVSVMDYVERKVVFWSEAARARNS
jgi:NitT/TauT family transport system permease protein